MRDYRVSWLAIEARMDQEWHRWQKEKRIVEALGRIS
jgi:hypothetical protein